VNKHIIRGINVLLISIILNVSIINIALGEVEVKRSYSFSKTATYLSYHIYEDKIDGRYISNVLNSINNSHKYIQVVRQRIVPIDFNSIISICNINFFLPYINNNGFLIFILSLTVIIILLLFFVKDYTLRKKAEKEMILTKNNLQESYMELEAAHEQLLSSEEELNRQFIELQQKEEALRISRERYRLASKGAEVGMWDWDFNLSGIYLSTKAKEIVGLEEKGLIPSDIIIKKIVKIDRDLFKSQFKSHYDGKNDIFEVKCRIRVSTQQFSWVYIRGKILFDEGKPIRIAGSINNINKEKLSEAKIKKLAYYDELTNIPNKAFYNKTIKRYRKDNRTEKFAILFVDLDNFKSINDCLGYEYGDNVLKKIVEILSNNIKFGDELIRFGGDEFIIIARNFDTKEQLKNYAENIIRNFRETIQISGFGLSITLSIGISVYPNDDDKLENLLKHADMALNEAKHKGKDRCEVYSKELNDSIVSKVQLERDLRQAIANNEFKLYYQPKFNLTKDKIIGYESLIRWQHPERGLVSPIEFIPFAEEVGLILPIGEWVIKESINQLSKWNNMGYKDISISINLSPKQFKDINLITLFKNVLREKNVQAKYIELEITETTAIYDMGYAVKVLKELREIGFKIALDDFGTGYSSLNYLNSLPIDILKIDKSFIDNIIVKKEGEQIIKSVISLAHAYSMEVIAEGVETEEQLDFLREENCDAIQGYYVSKPKINCEAISMIDDGRRLIG
jgi:diguanylate cyclase (GGDEF)-like protein/PAS domain S-box-containing protein